MPSLRPSLLTALLARSVLALMLLFAQAQSATHWLSHVAEAKHAKPGGSTPAEHCDECLALSALGAAASSAALALPSGTAHHVLADLPAASATPAAAWPAFHSRAPPILS